MYKDTYADWDFARSQTALFGDTLAGFAFTSELAGPGGCHIHIWLPEAVAEDPEQRKAVEAEASRIHDVVSMSWSPVTPDVEAWFGATKLPKGCVHGTLDALVAWHHEGKGLAPAFWGKGRRLTIDAFSLSALAAVADGLNEANREKLAGWIAEGPERCQEAIGKCLALLNNTAA